MEYKKATYYRKWRVIEFGGSVKYLSVNGTHKIVKKLKNRLVDLCKEVLDEQTIGGQKYNE